MKEDNYQKEEKIINELKNISTNVSAIIQNRIDVCMDVKTLVGDEFAYTNFYVNPYDEINEFLLSSEEYNKLIKENDKDSINFNLLFDLFIESKLHYDKTNSYIFLDFVNKFDIDSNLYLAFANYFYEHIEYFTMNAFHKKLLNSIEKDKRINICLVPYCKDLETLKGLISLGFDINQTDEKGRNILYYLLTNKFESCYDKSIAENNMELLNYLLNNLDLSRRDTDGKTMLYYSLQNIPTLYENFNHKKEETGTLTQLEKAVVLLINNMSKDDIDNDDINKIFEERDSTTSNYGEAIDYTYIYQYHKDLFTALIDKGFVLSDKLLDRVFNNLYPDLRKIESGYSCSYDDFLEEERKNLRNKIDLDKTYDFLYQKLDHNTKVQKINLTEEYKEFIKKYENSTFSFDEYQKDLVNFYKQINKLKYFYYNTLRKKYNPQKYLEYAKERFNTTYDSYTLNAYLLGWIIKGVRNFKSENLEKILELVPSFNIKFKVVNKDIGISYYDHLAATWNYREEQVNEDYFEPANIKFYGENIIFTGGLMQYAILTDDLEMVKFLQRKGVKLNLVINGKDHTMDYVCSNNMRNYLESFLGKDYGTEEKTNGEKILSKTNNSN